jgi:hypothetical protein
LEYVDDGHATGYQPHYLKGEGPQMSEVFDDIIDRETDVAHIAAVVASDFRFAIFRHGAFAVRLLRLDQKLADGIPMNPRRMANTLNNKL